MTPSEFKAWFDGFTEAFEGRIPIKAQWSRVKERVAEIDGKPVTERIYLDRYWPTIYPPYQTYPRYVTYGGTSSGVTTLTGNASQQYAAGAHGSVSTFNSSQAMTDLGRAEASSLAA